MNQRALIGRLLSPAGFGLVLIFFLLPFVTVSCGNDAATVQSTFTGLDLATGGSPTVAHADQLNVDQLIAVFADSLYPEPLILLAALAVVAAMAVGFVRDRVTHHGASLVLAVLACGLLVAEIRHAPSRVVAAFSNVGGANSANAAPLDWSMRPQVGFWLSSGVLVLLAATHASALVRATQRVAEQRAELDRQRSGAGDDPPPDLDDPPGAWDRPSRRADAGLGLLDPD